MYTQVHCTRALYKNAPGLGSRFLQIAIVELDGFHLKVFEGDVLASQAELFEAKTETAEISMAPNFDPAIIEAKRIFEEAVGDGWVPYHEPTPGY